MSKACTDPRQYWQIPTPEFVGVAATFAGEHPLRSQSVSAEVGCQIERHGARAHALLPEGFTMAPVAQWPHGWALRSPDARTVGLYQRRLEGYFLHIAAGLRGSGQGLRLGSRFLAACVDVQSQAAGCCVWEPGSYSDAGLACSIAAHRLLVAHAASLGHAIEPLVQQHLAWRPPELGTAPIDARTLAALATLADDSQTHYKEIMAVAAMMAGRQATLLGLYDTCGSVKPYTFLLELAGVGTFSGADPTTRKQTVADIVKQYEDLSYGPTADRLAWQPVALDTLCGHKNFSRGQACALVAGMIERGIARPQARICDAA